LTAEPSNCCIVVGLKGTVRFPLPPLPPIEPKPDGNGTMPAEGISKGLMVFSFGTSRSPVGTPMSPAEVELKYAGLSIPPLVAVVVAGVAVSLFDPAIDAEERTSLTEDPLVIAVTPDSADVGRTPATRLEAGLMGAVVTLVRLDSVDARFEDWLVVSGIAPVIEIDMLADDERLSSVGNDVVVDAALLGPDIPAEDCNGAKAEESVLKSDAPGNGMEIALNPGG